MRKLITLALVAVAAAALFGADLTADQKKLVDAQMKAFAVLGTDPTVVKAVKDYNAAPPAELAGVTAEKWAKLSVLSPEVKYLTTNALAVYLKTKKTPIVAELFVSAANGNKVAFFGKTSSWCHKGKPKFDVPMTGKQWTGAPELDESSGKQTVQISFPVIDAGKPIGAIVVGLDMAQLK